MISDIESEEALLSSLINHGFDSYHNIAALGINANSFSHSANSIIYKCLEHLFEIKESKNIDIPLIINSAKSLGYEHWINQQETKNYILDIKSVETKLENCESFAKKLRKLEVANNIYKATTEVQQNISDITGDESLGDIFAIVETKLANLAGFLSDSAEAPHDIGSSVREHMKKLEESPVDQMGIPTGFPIFDKYIGGGLRKHAITVIGARPKCGKSTLCKNIAYNVARLGIPVLYFDTEMETEDQINRLVASVSDVDLTEIEAGKYVDNIFKKTNVENAINDISKIDFKHKNISGMSLESQIAIARKWIIRDVGLNKDGKAKDCVLVYDYIKMMDSKELNKGMQEYQALGFLTTSLQNFAVKYDIPILTAVQLNRDGISVEDTSVIGGSDRISMYGSSISLLKWKSPEEMEAENYGWGNQKLIPLISRYGPQMELGDYINVNFNKYKNKMLEQGTRGESQTNTGNRSIKSDSEKKKYIKRDVSSYAKKSNIDNNANNNDDLVEF